MGIYDLVIFADALGNIHGSGASIPLEVSPQGLSQSRVHRLIMGVQDFPHF